MLLSDKDHTDFQGKKSFISLRTFKKCVINLGVCFLCAENDKKQNKEHIIPNWILNRYDLHNKELTLPNNTRIKYKNYVLPCCVGCNSLLNQELENPISDAFSKGYEGILNYIKSEGITNIYLWLALIFTKTHIKDQNLRMHRDFRSADHSIAESSEYEWECFHHIYCLSRVPLTKATMDSNCIGSCRVFRINNKLAHDNYDYIDLSYANTVGLVIGDIGVIVVFGDAGIVSEKLKANALNNIGNEVSDLQFRELTAHFACCYLHLKNPPRHSTITNSSEDFPPHIICQVPKSPPEFETYQPRIFGFLMDKLLGDMLDGKVDVPNFRELLRLGELTILQDSEGKFLEPD